jgi:hypothetical protein
VHWNGLKSDGSYLKLPLVAPPCADQSCHPPGKEWHLAGLENNEKYYKIAKRTFGAHPLPALGTFGMP